MKKVQQEKGKNEADRMNQTEGSERGQTGITSALMVDKLLAVEIWTREGIFKIVNYYNTCNKISMEILGELSEYLEGKVICCGDFTNSFIERNQTLHGRGVPLQGDRRPKQRLLSGSVVTLGRGKALVRSSPCEHRKTTAFQTKVSLCRQW